MRELPFQRDGLKALVFDLDGTLYQNERMGEQVNLAACNYIASLKGVSVEEADSMLREARYRMAGSGGTLSRAVESLGGNLRGLHQQLSQDVHPEGVLTVDPRVTAMLRALATRFAVHIYTNNNRSLSARIMKEIGVVGLFGKVFTIEDYWHPKPDQDALLGILEAIACRPEETLFVGDRFEVDLALPAKLGCRIYEACTADQLLELSRLVEE
ncbi:HAD family hydrolase [Geomonas sp.]|uniref:HAD family hydrolase n=1 Tax=Geomonas sp. TaxID=2651584 RepID=UPI002B4AA495|nr:HAD family hydrolase [Geomonas sp.]HJV34153.1 HAD family hydrolase [Geomonas sp.]